jgi:hypothetical protein
MDVLSLCCESDESEVGKHHDDLSFALDRIHRGVSMVLQNLEPRVRLWQRHSVTKS